MTEWTTTFDFQAVKTSDIKRIYIGEVIVEDLSGEDTPSGQFGVWAEFYDDRGDLLLSQHPNEPAAQNAFLDALIQRI
jgi:hypothetical protein